MLELGKFQYKACVGLIGILCKGYKETGGFQYKACVGLIRLHGAYGYAPENFNTRLVSV